MGCGASKHADLVTPGKRGEEPSATVALQKVPSKATDRPPVDVPAPSIEANQAGAVPVAKPEEPEAKEHVAIAAVASDQKLTKDSEDGPSQPVSVPEEPGPSVVPAPASPERMDPATPPRIEPVSPGGVEPEAQRSSATLRVQELQESPKTARFEADESAAEAPAPRAPSLMALKSSRSLNRSFGVKRRGSDASSQGSQAQPLAAAEEEFDAGPDPLQEEFERMKAANPWLAGVSRKSTATNVLTGRTSEKSSKRPSVGFALGGTCDDEGAATDEDVDPEEHIEAERIASIHVPPEEVPAPVLALRLEMPSPMPPPASAPSSAPSPLPAAGSAMRLESLDGEGDRESLGVRRAGAGTTLPRLISGRVSSWEGSPPR